MNADNEAAPGGAGSFLSYALRIHEKIRDDRGVFGRRLVLVLVAMAFLPVISISLSGWERFVAATADILLVLAALTHLYVGADKQAAVQEPTARINAQDDAPIIENEPPMLGELDVQNINLEAKLPPRT